MLTAEEAELQNLTEIFCEHFLLREWSEKPMFSLEFLANFLVCRQRLRIMILEKVKLDMC